MTPLQLRIPELVPGTDIRSLPLSALEGFVLSRIDGRASVLDIVSLTGLPQEQVLPILDKLVSLRAVRYTDVAHSQRPGSVSQPPASKSQPPRPGSDRPDGRRSDRPGSTSAIPRRRSAHSLPPRRVLSESGVSQSAPDIPSARSPSKPAAPRVPGSRPPSKTPPPGPSAPPSPASGAGVGAYRSSGSETPSRVDRTGNKPPEPRGQNPPRPAGGPAQPSARPPVTGQGAKSGPTSNPFDEDPATNVIDRLVEPGPANAIMPGPPSQPDMLAGVVGEKLLYDPQDLLEEVDLPMERRKQVLDLYYRREEYDYYELLGVPYEADKKEVRSAYFGLSKIFHPDTMFRKNLGSFKAKMEATFTVLSEAYETLSKKKARDEYDAYLRATKKTQMAERTLRQREAEAKPTIVSVEPPAFGPPTGTAPVVTQVSSATQPRASAPIPSARPVPPAMPSQAPQPPVPPREVSDEARRLAQQVMQRRLRGVMASPPQQKGQHPAVPPPAPEPTGRTDPHEIVRRLAKTLKDVGQVTGTNDQLTRYLKASQAAFARGDLAEATQQMRRAVSHAPDRTDLMMEHERLAKMLAEKMATDYEAQAQFEMKNNKWGAAALSWGKVCEGRGTDATAHRNAAQCMLKAGADLRGAQKYAQQAAFLEPDVVDHRLLLAQIYLTIGLKLNAKRELDAAAKLDPGNEMVKNLLGDLGS